MKNKIWFTLNLLLLLAILSFSGARAMPVVQTSGLASNSFGVSPTFTLANCETTVVPGFTTFCPIGTGQIYYCLASTTTCATAMTGWVLVGGAAAAPSLTLNGTTKPLPGPFTISVSSGIINSPVMTTTAQ